MLRCTWDVQNHVSNMLKSNLVTRSRFFFVCCATAKLGVDCDARPCTWKFFFLMGCTNCTHGQEDEWLSQDVLRRCPMHNQFPSENKCYKFNSFCFVNEKTEHLIIRKIRISCCNMTPCHFSADDLSVFFERYTLLKNMLALTHENKSGNMITALKPIKI